MSVKPKAAHIADLKRFVPSASLRGTSPHEFWDVGVVGQGGTVFTMRIALPPDFPMRPPVLQILQRVRHQYIDPNCIVLLQSLQQWNPATSSLGASVAQAMKMFSELPLQGAPGPPPSFFVFPPPPTHGPTQGMPGPGTGPPDYTSVASGGSGGGGGSGGFHGDRARVSGGSGSWEAPDSNSGRGGWDRSGHRSPAGGAGPTTGAGGGAGAGGSGRGGGPGDLAAAAAGGGLSARIRELRERHPLPKPPSSFPRLRGLGDAVLVVMKSDESQARAFLDTEPAVLEYTQTVFSELAQERSKTSSMLKQNLVKEAQFERLKREVETLKQQVIEKRRELDAANAEKARHLRSLHKPSERLCDELSEKFLDAGTADSGTLRSFISNYLQQRTVYHRNKAMVAHYFSRQGPGGR